MSLLTARSPPRRNSAGIWDWMRYLSRILSGFEKHALVEKIPSTADGRQSLLMLTAHGREVFAPLDQHSNIEVAGMLSELSAVEQNRLIEAMHTIETRSEERRVGKE